MLQTLIQISKLCMVKEHPPLGEIDPELTMEHDEALTKIYELVNDKLDEYRKMLKI